MIFLKPSLPTVTLDTPCHLQQLRQKDSMQPMVTMPILLECELNVHRGKTPNPEVRVSNNFSLNFSTSSISFLFFQQAFTFPPSIILRYFSQYYSIQHILPSLLPLKPVFQSSFQFLSLNRSCLHLAQF